MINISLVMRILVLLAVCFSCIYGFRQLQKGNDNKYFLIVLYGMLALLLSRIYYLAIVISDGNDSIFTIGTLGQASAYLFFILANTKYLSKDFENALNKKIYIPGIICLILSGFALISSAIKFDTLSAYIGEIIYLITMGNSLYISLCVIHNRKNIFECNCVSSFNICTSLLIILNILLEVVNAYIVDQSVLLVIYGIQTFISVMVLILMMSVLKKGVDVWKR